MKSSSKRTTDKMMLTIWLALIIVNVVSHFISSNFGGIIMVAIYWGFALYFNLVFGEKQERGKIKIGYLVCFSILFFIENQLLRYNASAYSYNTMGISFNYYVWQFLSTFFPVILSAMGIMLRSDNDLKNWLRKAMTLMFAIIAITTIGILQTNPSVSKNTAASGEDSYYPFLAGYGLTYAMPLIVPSMLVGLRKWKNKVVSIIILALIIVCTVFTSFFLAILAMIIGIACFLLLKINNKFLRISSLVVLIGGVVYAVFSGSLVNLMFELSEIIPMENIAVRLKETALAMTTGETGNTTVRFDLYSAMLKLILKHPITGNVLWNPNMSNSGHSTNLDIIAGNGLIVFCFYLAFWINIYKEILKNCVDRSEKAAAISTFVTFLFISTFNPVFSAKEVAMVAILAVPVFCNGSIEEQIQLPKNNKFESKYIKKKKIWYAGNLSYK